MLSCMWRSTLAGLLSSDNNEHHHQRDVLQKLPAERSGATSCDRLRTPGEGIRAGDLAGIRSRHAQAWRPQLWLGVSNRGPMTANGIYQMIARQGRQAGVDAWTHRFRHHFSHTWLDRGGAEGDLMELNGWSSPQMLRRYGARAAPARAAPTTASFRTGRDTSHDRVTGGGLGPVHRERAEPGIRRAPAPALPAPADNGEMVPRTSTPETSPPAPSPAGSRCVILAVGTGGIGTETASAGPSGCPAWPTLNP